ncbi:DUF1905 domain-containing protein [Herbiconiux sp. UC225_62]|uniref:DUF1905 domain-containing protein n=1 Tax=Herbiconiux sp. UC225_62 TaxID=3350168 RepID=UPI0036D38942
MGDTAAFDHTFTAVLQGDMGPHKWTCAILPDSPRILGSARSVKVVAEVAGVEFTTSMLPHKGDHMLPLKQSVLDAIGKAAGDPVTVRITAPSATTPLA